MNIEQFKQKINTWGHQQVPFLFVIDFEMKKPLAWKMEEINDQEILFDLNGLSNTSTSIDRTKTILRKFPISRDEYKTKFDGVMNGLLYGDSFLANLTIKTKIEIECTLKQLFYRSQAKYKMWLKDQFLFFSPEIFVQIRDQKISSFPMKGTINAEEPNAAETILSDAKEFSEHVTMVDLIRNDLSQVAKNVQVEKFRYIDELKTTESKLLQVSSKITGDLSKDYKSKLGDILARLLPAGSISGAPKVKTIGLIKKAEGEKRGYYTGVMGYFDGVNLDSCVMIRFIEENEGEFYYRSGGGITTQSLLQSEYEEAISKIYVPIN
jgi:para-aminobenzoate synthetase component 1